MNTSILKVALTAAVLGSLAFGSIYTVEEGHVGIVKRFSEAKSQVEPGLHFKIPLIDSIDEIEIRTRKNVEQMSSATKEQMPITATVSVNWTVNRSAALELYRQYGSLEQFEQRMLDPRFRSAVKDALPRSTAEELIQDRSTAMGRIQTNLVSALEGLPVEVDGLQIEDIQLPPRYIQSIEAKQTELNLAAAEEHKLERQRLEALRDVNTADAKSQSILKIAEAEAEATRLRGDAEAYAIEKKAKALRDNPLIIELTKAQQWNGTLPTTVMGDGQAIPMINLK